MWLTLPKFTIRVIHKPHQSSVNLKTDWHDASGDSDVSTLSILLEKGKKNKRLSRFQKECISVTFVAERKKKHSSSFTALLLITIKSGKRAEMVTPTGKPKNFWWKEQGNDAVWFYFYFLIFAIVMSKENLQCWRKFTMPQLPKKDIKRRLTLHAFILKAQEECP